MLRSALNIRSNFQAFSELLILLTRHKLLTYELARREIMDRYAGQFFGIVWTFIHPLVLIMVYIFLFNFVYVTKLGNKADMPLDMTTYILAGIIPWLAFSESMNKASTVIVNNANLVKQVVFPIEVLPVKGVIATIFTEAVFVIFLTIYLVAKYHSLSPMYLLLPVLLALQILAMIGVSYTLSATGVYLRDTKDFVQVFLSLGFWFVPILYLPQAIPEAIRPILYLNPFSHMIWCFQDVFYFGRFEHPWSWGIFALLSLGIFLYGYRLFRKFKSLFGNVL